MAGWIALRFLNDPSTALEHFARIDEGSADPVVRARAAYWRGRAAEAAGRFEEMRAQYEAAARYPTAYYGQLANARLGLGEIALRSPQPEPAPSIARELVHAADILYSIGERDLAVSFMTDLAKESNDVASVAAVGQVTARYNDAQTMLLLGKTALARGMAMDQYAFPDIGVPLYSAIGPQLDRCVVYSIVRTESGFDQRDKSPANAVGLMQVTPEAGRDTAKRFGVAYDWNRLVSDPVYNTQMGAAEVAALAQGVSRLLRDGVRRLQCWPWPGRGMGSQARRSARSQGRCGRLGRAHSIRRDAQLRAACHGEPAGLLRALRRQHRDCGAQPASRGDDRVARQASLNYGIYFPLTGRDPRTGDY